MQFNIGNKKIQSKTRLYHNSSENDYKYINKAILERPVVRNANADYMKKGVMQELYFRAGSKNIFSVKVWGQISDRSLPSVMSYEGNDQSNINKQLDTTLKAVVDWNSYLGRFKLTARSAVDYQQTNYQLRNYISGVGMIPAINSSSKSLSWYNHLGAESQNGKRLSWKTAIDAAYFNVNTHESVKATGYDKIRTDLSFFGGLYYHLYDWINLSVIIRDEYIERDFSPIMFNVGASIRPFDKKDFILKANFSRNNHHPTLNDLYWQPGGNPDLLPEKSSAFEVSAEHYITQKEYSFEQVLTSYYSDIDNWIIWLPSFQGYWQPFNLKKVKSYGLEYHVKFSRQIGLLNFQLYGNYALTKSLNYGERLFLGDGSYGKQLPFLPVHSAGAYSGTQLFRIVRYSNIVAATVSYTHLRRRRCA